MGDTYRERGQGHAGAEVCEYKGGDDTYIHTCRRDPQGFCG
jgi:hypothetical protein